MEAVASETGRRFGALASRVEPYPDLALYWRAFCELSASRPVGFGPCGIRPTDIAAWCGMRGLSARTTRSVAELVGILDVVWLELAAADAKANR